MAACTAPSDGSYGSDLSFFKENEIETVELASEDASSRVMLIPAWQARVMTSTTGGLKGRSYGWINRKFIASGEVNPQFNSFGGDVINSYNDGPTDTGVIMGPFYEIETSSPGAALKPGETLTHTQYTLHFEGSEEELSAITEAVFGISLKRVAEVF